MEAAVAAAGVSETTLADPRLIQLRQLVSLSAEANAKAASAMYAAQMAVIAATRLHGELISRLELLEMELGLYFEADEQECDEHEHCGVGA
jgi:hypothetical protein